MNKNHEVTLLEIVEIENSIRHLIRSNIELTRALEQDNDEVYKESIEENKIVIAKKQQMLKKLKEQIEKQGAHMVPKMEENTNMDTDDGVYL